MDLILILQVLHISNSLRYIFPHSLIGIWLSAYYESNKKIEQVDDSNGRDRRILSIENVTREDNGRYVCKVVNKYGISVQSAWLSAGNKKKIVVFIISITNFYSSSRCRKTKYLARSELLRHFDRNCGWGSSYIINSCFCLFD